MDESDPMAIPPFLRRTPAPEATQKETDMARRKKQTEPEAETANPTANYAESIPDGAASAAIGHNSKAAAPVLTDDDKQRIAIGHKKAYQTALAVKKEADAKFKNVCKLAKAEITWTDGVALLKDMILLETDDGDKTIQADIERKLMAARYQAIPIGSQFELFPDRMPAEDRAYAEGKRDAMAGEALRNLYNPGVPQFGRYAEGWHDGQRAMVDAQRARDAEVFDGVGPEEAAALADIEKNGIAGAIGTAAPTYEMAH